MTATEKVFVVEPIMHEGKRCLDCLIDLPTNEVEALLKLPVPPVRRIESEDSGHKDVNPEDEAKAKAEAEAKAKADAEKAAKAKKARAKRATTKKTAAKKPAAK